MKEFITKSKEILCRRRDDKSTWYTIGRISFFAYVAMMFAFTVKFFAFLIIEDGPHQEHKPKSFLDAAILYRLFFIFYMEILPDQGSRLSWTERILLRKRFVAFGEQASKFSQQHFRIEVLLHVGIFLVTILFFIWKQLTALETVGILTVTVIGMSLLWLIRYSFSRFFYMSSKEDIDYALERLDYRTEGHIQTTSRFERSTWKTIAMCSNVAYIALALMIIAKFGVSMFQSVSHKDDDTPKSVGNKNLMATLLCLTVMHCMERMGVDGDVISKDFFRIIYRKRFLAFGPNATKFARIWYFINILCVAIHFGYTIRFYTQDKLSTSNLVFYAITDFLSIFLQTLMRYSFSKHYSMTSREELDKAIKIVEDANLKQNSVAATDAEKNKPLLPV